MSIIRREISGHGPLRVRENADGSASRTIEGRVIVFNRESEPLWGDDKEEIREIILPSAVTRELLDRSDIKMTLFHDNHRLLARSKRGKGNLGYEIDDEGVTATFEAPATPDGDTALELVRSGVLDGCSFAFTLTREMVKGMERTVEEREGKKVTLMKVGEIEELFDFTLTGDPAYPQTSVGLREAVNPYLGTEGGADGLSEEAEREIEAVERAAEIRWR